MISHSQRAQRPRAELDDKVFTQLQQRPTAPARLQVAGDPAVAPQVGKFMGVRNGIDIDIWDPETDSFLPRQYGPDSVVEGKAAAREELRQRLGLTGWGDKPLVGCVSRLTAQKGTTRLTCRHNICGLLSVPSSCCDRTWDWSVRSNRGCCQGWTLRISIVTQQITMVR